MSKRSDFLKQYSESAMMDKAREIVKGLSVEQVVDLSEKFIGGLPDHLPKKRLKMRGRVFCAESELFGRMRRYEKVEF